MCVISLFQTKNQPNNYIYYQQYFADSRSFKSMDEDSVLMVMTVPVPINNEGNNFKLANLEQCRVYWFAFAKVASKKTLMFPPYTVSYETITISDTLLYPSWLTWSY